jgi:cytochrome c553
MKKLTLKIVRWIGLPGAAILVFCAMSTWLLVSCSTTSNAEGGAANSSVAASGGKSGAELWADNCVRCHNIRSPSSYSPAQWEVATMHMRIRANLTPEEHKKILEFLKSGT